MGLFYATRGDAVVYAAAPALFGVMKVAEIDGDRVACIVDGQVFGEIFDRDELRLASAEEKRRAPQIPAARACDASAEALERESAA